MQLLTQKTLSWAQHLSKAGRLGSTAGPGGPSGSWVVDFWCPLCLLSMSVLTDIGGSCVQLLSGWGVQPQKETCRFGGKKEILVILILE